MFVNNTRIVKISDKISLLKFDRGKTLSMAIIQSKGFKMFCSSNIEVKQLRKCLFNQINIDFVITEHAVISL